MLINTKYRSNEKEIMDDLSMEGETLRKTLDQIAGINRRLGGNNATLQGLQTLLKRKPSEKPAVIIDLGCGNGDMLRMLAEYGRKNKRNFKLLGIDANGFTVNYARELSASYPEISFLQMDIWSDAFRVLEYDIAIATLFLHHFSDEEIIGLLNSVLEKAATGIIINDLQRSRMAYYGFKGISLFIRNPMVKNDGAISVLRGFKRTELETLGKKIKTSVCTIQWKWAFRYLWIIKKQ